MTDRPRQSRTPTIAWTGGAVTALALLLAGCASGTEAGDTPATPAVSASASPSPTSPSPSGSPSAASPTSTPTPSASPTASASTAAPSEAAADVTVDIRIADGKVTTGVQNVKVKSGQSVLIRGVSDVADSLHVHGYDKSLDLKPGKPAEVTFTADVTGVFEIETHETAKLVAKLTVS